MKNSKFNLSQSNSVKFIDVCSGIGTTRVALQANGWKCVGRFEIDPVADAIYQSLFGSSEPNFGDVTSLPMELPDFDVLVASIPGHTYSRVYNKGKRPDTAVMFGIASLLGCYRPKGFILESVAGFGDAYTNPNYRLFLSLLKAMGYEVEASVCSARHHGLPITTKRFVMMGSLSGLPRIAPANIACNLSLSDCLVGGVGDALDTSSKAWADYISKAGAAWGTVNLHALEDYTIIDRRQTDLRVFRDACPPFRKGNHGLFYVKAGRIKRISAYEALLMHGVPYHIAQKIAKHPISEHSLLSYVGTATPVPMLETAGKRMEVALLLATSKAA